MIFSIKRKSKYKNLYHPNMGNLITKVTTIKKTFLKIPYKTLHVYRETYHGKIKDVKDCKLSKI